MDMDVAAAFLAGSILFSLSVIALVIGIVVVNNIIHKYWKPIQVFKFPETPTYRFVDDENKVN